MTTAMHWTEKLLNEGLRIMYYSGNMDFIIAYPLSENAYRFMKWNGSEKYRAAKRESFIVNSKMAGYVSHSLESKILFRNQKYNDIFQICTKSR